MINNKKFNNSEIYFIFSILKRLSKKRKSQIIFNFLAILVSGFAEFISLGLVIPFLGIILDPNIIWNKDYIQKISGIFGYTSGDQLILPISIFFIFSIIFANGIRTFNIWFTLRLSAAIGSDISSQMYSKTLNQPLLMHLNRNSSSVIVLLTKNTSQSANAIKSFLQIISASIISLSIIFLLFIVNPSITLLIIILFGLSYLSLAFIIRKKLSYNSGLITSEAKKLVQLVQEGIGSIREILLRNNQILFVNKHNISDKKFRTKFAENTFLTSFSKFIMEPIGITLIASIAILMKSQNYASSEIIGLLGTFALGSQRLLPSLQELFRSWGSIKINRADLKAIYNFLNLPDFVDNYISNKPIIFEKNITLKSIRFRYNKETPMILKGLNLVIKKGEKIGIIGPTGSGKSTLIDILLGLIEPNEGEFLIDNINVLDKNNSHNIKDWRSIICHVPQDIYLSDSTIKENICFGETRENINIKDVISASKKAGIHSFINKLPNKYETFVGERGLRLSGGQKQRIGLARALYNKSQVVILDEATSSLDNETEKSVMNSIYKLGNEITIIMIAHRLTTLQNCDRIIKIKDGQIASFNQSDKDLNLQQ